MKQMCVLCVMLCSFWWIIIIDSGKDLQLDMYQSINWTNDDPIYVAQNLITMLQWVWHSLR